MIHAKPINITHKKQINEIGAILIETRREIRNLNPDIAESDQSILKLVLFGCLYVQITSDENIKYNKCATDFTLICNLIDSNLNISFADEYLGKTIDIKKISYAGIIEKLYKIKAFPAWIELLPYALELLDYSEADLSLSYRDRRNGIITKKKKHSGIYYTPADVAQYMATECIAKIYSREVKDLQNIRFMDFSCGSGVFLLQILSVSYDKKIITNADNCLGFIEQSIYGMDISRFAVECAKFCIISYCLSSLPFAKNNIGKLLEALNRNIVSADGTKFEEYISINTQYPKTFNCIIGNPPYVSNTSTTENLFIPFVYNIIKHSEENSVCSLVLPLSFSYNNKTDFCQLREFIQKDNAQWQVEHYDRSPDSLFGDDVKSRVCIVYRNSNNAHSLRSTKLMRWTSIFREQLLFSPKETAEIADLSISKFIPKLSSDMEKDCYSKLTNNGKSLLDMFNMNRRTTTPYKVIIKGTAYNWICAYDHIPHSYEADGTEFVSKELKSFCVSTQDEQYFAIAVLNSKIAFWLWTVIGDGFHITNNLFSTLRICKDMFSEADYRRIIQLGQDISSRLVEYKNVTINSGKTITNYNHLPLLDLISEIDNILCNTINAPEKFSNYLSQWYFDFITCGRNS